MYCRYSRAFVVKKLQTCRYCHTKEICGRHMSFYEVLTRICHYRSLKAREIVSEICLGCVICAWLCSRLFNKCLPGVGIMANTK